MPPSLNISSFSRRPHHQGFAQSIVRLVKKASALAWQHAIQLAVRTALGLRRPVPASNASPAIMSQRNEAPLLEPPANRMISQLDTTADKVTAGQATSSVMRHFGAAIR